MRPLAAIFDILYGARSTNLFVRVFMYVFGVDVHARRSALD